MKHLASLLLACLCSCSNFQYTATAPDGGTETVAYFTFGGSSAMETAGGTRLTQNHNKTAGQAMQAATAIAGGITAAYTKNSDNAVTTSATQSNNAAATAKVISDNKTAVEQARIAAEASEAALKLTR